MTGEQVAGTAIEHRKERLVPSGSRPSVLPPSHSSCQPSTALTARCRDLADLSARLTAFVTRETLRRVGQHELIAFFDDVTALSNST